LVVDANHGRFRGTRRVTQLAAGGADEPKLPGTHFPGFEVIPADPKAGLIIVHGIAEHGGRYRHVAAALAGSGIASFVYDQRGHGLHPGVRTHVDDFELFAEDVQTVAAAVQSRYPSLPLFVWGHSMGSVIVTLAAVHGMNWTRGVITSGCALDALPSLTGLRGLGLRLAVALLPRLRIDIGTDATKLTQVEEAQRQHMSDPLVPRSASLRLLHGFASACHKCKDNLTRIKLPWLAIHGTADRVCPVTGSQQLISGLAGSDKQLVLYPGLLHEPHNEDDAARTAMFSLMSTWILSRI
jgi:alpha-beta hydrolase superfamily lysophospholipase